MKKAIGMVEFKTVSSGMRAADSMVKTAEVDLLQADTVCPGKFLALISGELSAVNAAVEAASQTEAEQLIDRFVLGMRWACWKHFRPPPRSLPRTPPPKRRWWISLSYGWRAECAASPICC